MKIMFRRSNCLSFFMLLSSPPPAAPRPDKRVFRIDSLIATQKGGEITVQAKGAVQSGGWTQGPAASACTTTAAYMTVEFLATPPPPEMTVIDGLVPVHGQHAVACARAVPSRCG